MWKIQENCKEGIQLRLDSPFKAPVKIKDQKLEDNQSDERKRLYSYTMIATNRTEPWSFSGCIFDTLRK